MSLLVRAHADTPDFHMQHEGIITDVEMYSKCWHAGLRQGSRIVEVGTS